MGLTDDVEEVIGRVHRYFAQQSVDGARTELGILGKRLEEADKRGDDYRNAVLRYHEFRKTPDIRHIFDSEDQF
ncbi:MAG TPA: hypothetical protein VJB66_03465 [Candidatus Nanoarchaeia archaeon]|nr:hypothetical protein [Candidatus Nanoarchaeia archaeon]